MAPLSALRLWLLGALSVWLCASAGAATPEEQAERAELDRLRGEVANQVQLSAYDLVDELIYHWTQEPVFDKPTPVVLAGVSVPVGLGTGMQALVENHLGAVLAENPSTNLQLSHCPSCTAMVVHSGPEGTVVSRAYDNPEVLDKLGSGTGRHLLFLDIEAEGTWLVLRARITRLTPDLPIVWSHTLASSASTPALLRDGSALKSAEDARKEYLEALHDRGPITIPLRAVLRSYKGPRDRFGTVAPPPLLWVQSGVELGVTDARAWTTSFILGYSLVPQAYQGIMVQARVNRLITGRTRSLSRPDLYAFVGSAAITVWGPATAPFGEDPADAIAVQALADAEAPRDPQATFGTLHMGLDLRVGNRIGLSTFLESLPARDRSQNMGDYTVLIGIPFQSWGNEVTFWF